MRRRERRIRETTSGQTIADEIERVYFEMMGWTAAALPAAEAENRPRRDRGLAGASESGIRQLTESASEP